MIRAKTLTLDAGGSSTSPTRTVWKLTSGMIYRFELSFPPGPSGLVGVRVYDHTRQLYPLDEGEWFTGDAEVIAFDETHLVDVEPFELVILAYNADEKYSHSVQLRIGFLTRDLYIARFLPGLAADQIAAAFAALADSQSAERSAQTAALLEAGKSMLGFGSSEEG